MSVKKLKTKQSLACGCSYETIWHGQNTITTQSRCPLHIKQEKDAASLIEHQRIEAIRAGGDAVDEITCLSCKQVIGFGIGDLNCTYFLCPNCK